MFLFFKCYTGGFVTPEEKYALHYREMAKICSEQGWGDPFSYARSKEILAANKLGHTIAATLSGADAFNEKGQPVEYKSTIQDKCKGAYTGISVLGTWGEQVEYLFNEKIAKYPEHYFNRFKDGEMVESWVMSGDKVFEILVSKMESKFPTVRQKKDPRLSANISNTEIRKYGRRLI
jgi:hypothetical protein|tara:strand:+ start:222 stop:752 length:531 start_codon:yes stop_codon:yes gene_type:complete